ncbi:MAG: hypothetical protein IKM67_01775 [Clostridia bacterium]|nr:hypothetical protein [Clostridia bacterium]
MLIVDRQTYAYCYNSGNHYQHSIGYRKFKNMLTRDYHKSKYCSLNYLYSNPSEPITIAAAIASINIKIQICRYRRGYTVWVFD